MLHHDTEEMLLQLLETLSRQTRSGKITWTPTSSDTDSDGVTFSTRRTSFTVYSKDNDGTDPFIFEMLDSSGRMVRRLQTTSDGLSIEVEEAIRELWRTAASDEGYFLSQIRAALDDIEEPPF